MRPHPSTGSSSSTGGCTTPPREVRGKVARVLAGKLAIAARLDFYRGCAVPEFLDDAQARIDRAGTVGGEGKTMIRIGDVLVSKGEGGVYGERMLDGYRVWDPFRSKLAPCTSWEPVLNFPRNESALPRSGKRDDRFPRCRLRGGRVCRGICPAPDAGPARSRAPAQKLMPILADVSCPEQYAPLVETVDLLYQDVAQPDQAAIALKNCVFLKKGGYLVLMLKTRSVDIRKEPAEVFRDTLDILMSAGLTIVERYMACPVPPGSRGNRLHEIS